MSSNNIDTNSQLDYINRLIAELFQDAQRISHLLHQMGVRESVIVALRQKHLQPYLSQLAQCWQDVVRSELPERHADIIIRRYALNNQPPPTLADMGDEYGISRQRVQQLEQAGIKRLRSPRRRQLLQDMALKAVCEVSGLSPAEVVLPVQERREFVDGAMQPRQDVLSVVEHGSRE